MRVLIAEDDAKLGPLLVRGLGTESIAADLVRTGIEVLERARATAYAVIVLDRMLPDSDGLSVCASLRRVGLDTPVLMLSAVDPTGDRGPVNAAGVDDYLTKPFSFGELIGRIRALTSDRSDVREQTVLMIGDLRMDLEHHQVWRGEVRIDLSLKEFLLLEALMRAGQSPLSASDLLTKVWGAANGPDLVSSAVHHLREKIDRPFGRQSLKTIRGVGYRLATDLASEQVRRKD